MKKLDIDKNRFGVAPVGPIVIIGRYMTLRGGMGRDKVLNLVAWLLIASDIAGEKITAEEIAVEIERAYVHELPPGNVISIVEGKEQTPAQRKIQDFLGTLDEEEAAAVASALAELGKKKSG